MNTLPIRKSVEIRNTEQKNWKKICKCLKCQMKVNLRILVSS